ncbi:MAG: PaaI family thioesterase [Tuberibacillus sp.]
MNEKQALISLFNSILDDATPEQCDVLRRLLESARDVQTKREKTYLHGALKYRGELTGENSYKATIELSPFFLNNLNILHGGITATFADSAMGTLVSLRLPDHFTSVTSEIKVNYLRPVKGNDLHCHAEIIHRGKNLWITEAKIYGDDETKPAVFSSASFFVIPKK